MATTQVAGIQVETVSLPPNVKPTGSAKTLFLAAGGVRGIEIPGKFMKVSAIGVYVEDGVVPFLAEKWKGKSAEELSESGEFIHDFVGAPFDRLIRVTLLLPLTGVQYSDKVAEFCVANCESAGKYTDAEAVAIEKFREAFTDESLSPGTSIVYIQWHDGSTAIVITKDGTIPETGKTVVTNRLLSDSILESIIGLKGVSPTARQSFAARLSELMGGCENGKEGSNGEAGKTELLVV